MLICRCKCKYLSLYPVYIYIYRDVFLPAVQTGIVTEQKQYNSNGVEAAHDREPWHVRCALCTHGADEQRGERHTFFRLGACKLMECITPNAPGACVCIDIYMFA